jgi:hypothetical protein
LRRVARGGGIGLAAELVLEAAVALPAGDGVGVNVEDLGDRVGGVAGEEEAGGGELVGSEGAWIYDL